jgi:protein SCO1/2
MSRTDPAPQPPVRRWLLAAIAGAVAMLGLFVVGSLQARNTPPGAVAAPRGTPIVADFDLVDHTGRRVTEADFAGRPMVVFFGFTYCPDFCPTALATLGAAFDLLGPEAAAEFQPVFITIDPARDTQEALAAYVGSNSFPAGLVGLTGTEDEIAAAARAFRVTYGRVEMPDSAAEYTMEHTTIVYVMDAKGELFLPYTHNSTPAEVADGLRRYLAENRTTPRSAGG